MRAFLAGDVLFLFRKWEKITGSQKTDGQLMKYGYQVYALT